MLAKEEMKRRRMVKTPTNVLFVRDWTIFLVTVCIAAGKSLKTGSREKDKLLPLVMEAGDLLYYIF